MDRLSSLPHEICRQIASSLLMHEGVKLTVLSKRWSLVFSSVRRMIFSYIDFPDMENKPLQFAEFIDRMISQHDDSNIEEFELLFNVPIEAWIEFALSRNVKHLTLFLRILGNQTFPDCFFSCKSLESLCLGVLDRFLKFPPSIHLPNLKALCLFRIFLSEGDSIKHLISSCPALQNLLIERSVFTHLSTLVISSVSLVNLTIQNCSLVSLNILTVNAPSLEVFEIQNCYGLGNCEINLIVRSLLSFMYDADMTKDIKFQNILSVSNAKLVFQGSLPTHRRDRSLFAAKMLKGIQAKLFTLDYRFLEHLLPFSCDALMHLEGTSFDRVKYLQLVWPVKQHLQDMASFLSRFRSLTVLWITMFTQDEHLPQSSTVAMNSQDLGLVAYLNRLKCVEIEGFEGRESELDIVEFLLNNANVIEKWQISVSEEIEDNDVLGKTIRDRVLGLRRASSRVEIVFSETS